ncbi:MAG TPA: ACP S-malonyltransferase [Burkholderiaceae bacterium]|nr:ACP S-malonyltransferase [Burkholderiaceae bacterium]
MKLAFVFPGQGSQAVGMLDSIADVPAVADLIAAADAALGEPLSALIAQGPADALGLTVNTQPAMLLAGLACHAAWRAAGGPEAAAVAGHSLGEYTALTAAGAFEPGAALRLVRLRARAMQEAVPVGSGAMAAILGLEDEQVREACRVASEAFAGRAPAVAGVPDVVEPANFNAPSQVVIAGSRAAVEKACEVAKSLGAKRALPLPVSAPFHSSLLRPAGDRLAEALRETRPAAPRVPLVNNVDVEVQTDPAAIVDALVRQSYSPVRWVEVVRRLESMGVERVVEFGPGKVLAGLVKRISPSLAVSAVFDRPSLEAALKELA